MAASAQGVDGVMDAALAAAAACRIAPISPAGFRSPGRDEYRLSLGAVKKLALAVGMAPGNKAITPPIERESSAFSAASCAACSMPTAR